MILKYFAEKYCWKIAVLTAIYRMKKKYIIGFKNFPFFKLQENTYVGENK
jgi:hypothetical protein